MAKKDLNSRINAAEIFLAFDIGLKRTGAAKGSRFTKSSLSLVTRKAATLI